MTGHASESKDSVQSFAGVPGSDEAILTETAPSSFRSTFIDVANMLKAFIGLNFMYVAYAFAQAGLVRGVIGLVFIALVTEHCCLLLVEVKDRMPERSGRRKPPTYGDIARFAGGKPAEIAVNIALLLTQFGYCVGYLIFIAQTTHDLVRASNHVKTWTYVLMPVPLLCAIALLRSIRSLGPFSMLANVALLFGFLAVAWYIAMHFRWQYTLPSWRTYPLFFGQMTAALEGIGLVIPVETSMKDPSKFPFVLRTALIILTVVLMTVGTLGYMTFGAGTKSIILLNFVQTPLVNVVKFILILGILFTYPLQIFPVFQLAEAWVSKRQERREERENAAANAAAVSVVSAEDDDFDAAEGFEFESDNESDEDEMADNEAEQLHVTQGSSGVEKKARFVQEPWKVAFRLAVVVATAAIAVVAGRNFGLFQSLVGSMGASCLAYTAPAFFHVRVFRRSLTRREKIKDWLIFCFGIVGAVVGTVATLIEFAKVKQTGGHI